MNTLVLVLKEILHRKVLFSLGLLAVIIAVAMYVAMVTASKASNRETIRVMRDIGFNIRVIPEETDMAQFWVDGYSSETMPEKYIAVFASQKGISYNHLVATLKRKIDWHDIDRVILKGLAPEVCPPGKAKSPMAYEIERGTAVIGYNLAIKTGVAEEDTISIRGVNLKIAAVLAESGTSDDIAIQCHLSDAQNILGLPGKINEIKAIDCLCYIEDKEPLIILREQLSSVLPGAKVVQMKSIAGARAKQRQMIRKLFNTIMPAVIITCGIWIGVLAMINVNQRKQEIGIAKAIGFSSGRIATLFLGRAVLTGLAGAGLGYALGCFIALQYGPQIFKVTANAISAEPKLFWQCLAVTPIFAAISSFVPVIAAVAQDPAVTLRED